MGTSKNPSFCLKTQRTWCECLVWPWKQRGPVVPKWGVEAFVSPFPSASGYLSLRWSGEDQKALEIIREILQPNLEPSPNQPNRSNQFPTHRGDLTAKDMFDMSANAGPVTVAVFLAFS